LLGFHAGIGSTRKTCGYGGHPMNVHVHRWHPNELSALSLAAGFKSHPAPELPEDVLCFRASRTAIEALPDASRSILTHPQVTSQRDRSAVLGR
jgi:hypothetical protein